MSRIVVGNVAVAGAVLLHGDDVNDAELQAAIALSLESARIDDNTVQGDDVDPDGGAVRFTPECLVRTHFYLF